MWRLLTDHHNIEVFREGTQHSSLGRKKIIKNFVVAWQLWLKGGGEMAITCHLCWVCGHSRLSCSVPSSHIIPRILLDKFSPFFSPRFLVRRCRVEALEQIKELALIRVVVAKRPLFCRAFYFNRAPPPPLRPFVVLAHTHWQAFDALARTQRGIPSLVRHYQPRPSYVPFW